MTEDDRELHQHHLTSGIGWVVMFMLIPVFYVLSIGPVALLSEKGVLPQEQVRSFYKPVVWLHDNTPLEKPLELYGQLWGWH